MTLRVDVRANPLTRATRPTIILGGAQKAGTTSLFFLMGQHPDVFLPTVKEPGYFLPRDLVGSWAGPGVATFRQSYVADPTEYQRLFSGGRESAHRLEASTAYLSEKGVAAKIAREAPDAKLMFVLRDPVDRAYSAFNHVRNRGLEPLHEFSAGLEAEERRTAAGWAPYFGYYRLGCYGRYLERFYKYFDADQILCVAYEDLVRDPVALLRRIETFLGLPAFGDYDTRARHNPGGLPRSRALDGFLSLGSPQLRGRMRALLPDRAHRLLLAARERNLVAPTTLDAPTVGALVERYAEDRQRLSALIGQRLLRSWKSQ